MSATVELLHSSVPRLYEVVLPVPQPGLLSRLFARRNTALLREPPAAERGVVFWRTGDQWKEARRCPLQEGAYIHPGRLFIDTGTGPEAIEPKPEFGRANLLWRHEGFGALHVCLQTDIDDDETGRVLLRLAWQPVSCDWLLVVASHREAIDRQAYAGRKALIVCCDDIALATAGSQQFSAWKQHLQLGHLGRFCQAFGLAEPDFDRTNEDLLAIDFGTYESMAAILSKGSAKVRILPHPEPWYQEVVRLHADGSLEVAHLRNDQQLPAPVRAHRSCSRGDQRLGMPSQCLRIPEAIRGHDLFEEVALGEECDRLIDADPALLDAFRPCPKLFLATPNNADDGQVGHRSTKDRRVVISYLQEMFNSVAALQSAGQDHRVISQLAAPQRRAVRPVLFSFPVSLTEAQMNDLRRSFTEGLQTSQLQHSIPPGGRLEAAADEASAAALGVFFHSFANLPIRTVLDAYGPFGTNRRSDYARELDVLSIDLGGGTSDLVLLHMGKDNQRPGWRVDITEAFGVPRAGLAVTMRIAARLKQEILQGIRRKMQDEETVARSRKALNTNFAFHPPGGERPANISEHQWSIGNQRRSHTLAWYRLAEQIKYHLCECEDDDQPWRLSAEHLRELGVGELAGLCDPQSVQITREDLELITRMIFAAVLRKIREWLERYPVDLVVLAGRSFRLPGMRDHLDDILKAYNKQAQEHPAAGRRRLRRHNIVDLEWLEEHYGHLDLQDVASGIARDKALVVAGMVQRQSLLDNPTAGERLRSEFISSARRNRYIGLAERDMAAEGRNFVISKRHMIAIADEQIVRPEEDIRIPIAPGSTGFYLKINFLGPGPLEGEDAVDPPLSLARIAIEDLCPDPDQELEELTLIFRQKTASRAVLHAMETRRRNADRQTSDEAHNQGECTSLSCDQVNVRMDANMIFDDFRLDGIISPEIDVDDIGGAQPVDEVMVEGILAGG